MTQDFRDLLAELVTAGARFLVVGAHALAVHGVPRATIDLDVWIERSEPNVDRVWDALLAFGAPLEVLGITKVDLGTPDVVIQLGLPPYRIDLLTGVSGLVFAAAWQQRVDELFEDVRVHYLGRADLVRNKRATGRLKDLADLESLGEDPAGPTR